MPPDRRTFLHQLAGGLAAIAAMPMPVLANAQPRDLGDAYAALAHEYIGLAARENSQTRGPLILPAGLYDVRFADAMRPVWVLAPQPTTGQIFGSMMVNRRFSAGDLIPFTPTAEAIEALAIRLEREA